MSKWTECFHMSSGEGAAVVADFKCGTKGLMLLVR